MSKSALGEQLSNEFRKLTKVSPLSDEVNLFKCLLEAINKTAACKANIIHGSNHLISYNSAKDYIEPTRKKANPVKCELADMAFVVERNDEVRSFIVQNKKAKKGNLTRNSFQADLYQYELLHDRPIYSNTRRLMLPNGALLTGLELTNAITNSYSTYGVFYKESDNYDMRLYSAKQLIPNKKSGKCSIRSIYFDTSTKSFDTPIVTNGVNEIANCKNLIGFGEAIEKNLLGDPLTKANDSDTDGPSLNNMHQYLDRLSDPEVLNQEIRQFIRIYEENPDRLNENYRYKLLCYYLYTEAIVLIRIKSGDNE